MWFFSSAAVTRGNRCSKTKLRIMWGNVLFLALARLGDLKLTSFTMLLCTQRRMKVRSQQAAQSLLYKPSTCTKKTNLYTHLSFYCPCMCSQITTIFSQSLLLSMFKIKVIPRLSKLTVNRRKMITHTVHLHISNAWQTKVFIQFCLTMFAPIVHTFVHNFLVQWWIIVNFSHVLLPD